jgi:hypothetical protein
MFAGPLGQKTYACFVRRYDASHLAQHPKQKVSAMKLLVTSEDAPEDKTVNYSFRLGFKYRHRPGNFDSSGFCNHVVAEKSGNEIRLGCGIDCEGGGIEVAMSKDDKSTLIRLERIRIWERNKADEDAGNDLVAGANDKIFLRAFHSSSANPDLSRRIWSILQGRNRVRRVRQHHEIPTMKSQNVGLADLLPGFIAADRSGVVWIAELQSQGHLSLRP